MYVTVVKDVYSVYTINLIVILSPYKTTID